MSHSTPTFTPPAAPSNPSVTKDEFEKFQTIFYAVASGIVIVLFVGFITILMSSYALVMDSNEQKVVAQQQTNAKLDQVLQIVQNCNAKRTSGC